MINIEGKSQLDLYRIDKNTTLNEMLDKNTGEEYERIKSMLILTNSSNLTIQQANDISNVIIEYIINVQNSKPKSLHYSLKNLQPDTIGTYTLKLFEAKSMPQSPIVTLLGERIEGEKEKSANLSHILFVYDEQIRGALWLLLTNLNDYSKKALNT